MADPIQIQDIDVHQKLEPIVLVILDGWGMSAGVSGNAIRQANPQNFVRLWHEHPHGVLRAVSPVDEAAGNLGSSDVGHASIGAGRLLHSDASDISLALRSGDFFQAPGFAELVATTQANRRTLHVIGLLSTTSSHGHTDHLVGSLELARQQGLTDVVVHVILERGDDPRKSRRSLEKLQTILTERQLGRIGSVCGRTLALDRSGNWFKTRVAYQALIGRKSAQQTLNDLLATVGDAGQQPADLPPTTIISDTGLPVGVIRAGDTVLVTNTRADRTAQLVRALADHSALAWLGFIRVEPYLGLKVWTLTDYRLDLPDVHPVFRTAKIPDSTGRILADHGLAQVRISTVERSDHIGMFLSGGHREPFDHEQRLVANYQARTDPTTDSSCGTNELTRLTVAAIAKQSAPFIAVNLCAADSVAHTGDFDATVTAVAAVDDALGSIAAATLAAGGALIITADHGNAESLLQSRGAHHHTAAGVPWIVATTANRRTTRVSPTKLSFPTGLPDHQHSLADIAPTILNLFGIAKPSTMTGKSLV